MGSNPPGDPRVVDPFAPKGKIALEELPLAELKRYILGQLEAEKSQFPVGSVPSFAIERGNAHSQNWNIGNLTLSTAVVWTAFSTRIRVNVAMTGLSDMMIYGSGTAARSGASSEHALSVLIDGIEYQTKVHGQAANNGLGLQFLSGAVAETWSFIGRVPASKLDRKVYEVELVYRLVSGAATGLLHADVNSIANLSVTEV